MGEGAARVQYAALPWRRHEGEVEVLLITSRETKRWVIPKGWPMEGRTATGSAAQEAFEEAGVTGAAAEPALGSFHYEKRLKGGRVLPVRVEVFALEVAEVHDHWPEKAERTRRWMRPQEAAGLVQEPQLRALLAAFAP